MSAAVPALAGRAEPRLRSRFPLWGVAGFALFGLGLWALAADLEAWNAIWYLPAWYGYLLVLDAWGRGSAALAALSIAVSSVYVHYCRISILNVTTEPENFASGSRHDVTFRAFHPMERPPGVQGGQQ